MAHEKETVNTKPLRKQFAMRVKKDALNLILVVTIPEVVSQTLSFPMKHLSVEGGSGEFTSTKRKHVSCNAFLRLYMIKVKQMLPLFKNMLDCIFSFTVVGLALKRSHVTPVFQTLA